VSFDQVFHKSIPYVFVNVNSRSSLRHEMYPLDQVSNVITLNALYDMTS